MDKQSYFMQWAANPISDAIGTGIGTAIGHAQNMLKPNQVSGVGYAQRSMASTTTSPMKAKGFLDGYSKAKGVV